MELQEVLVVTRSRCNLLPAVGALPKQAGNPADSGDPSYFQGIPVMDMELVFGGVG